MWSRGPSGSNVADAGAQRFRDRRVELGLGPLVVHGNYLINLASPERVLRVRSIQAFHDELVRAAALGADFLVAHPGCGKGARMSSAVAAIADGLKQAARGVNFNGLRILLENTAGQGTSVGSRFAELKSILDQCPELPLGVCVDTAHLFAVGHDLCRPAGLDGALAEIAQTVGLERVFVVHVNDSKSALGSRLDRHEHIGKGKIGVEAFRRILNHPLLAGRAFILETPIDRPGDDRRNVRMLWRLVGITPKRTGNVSGWFSRAALEAQSSEKTQQRRKRATREIETTQEVNQPLSEYDPQAIEAKWQKRWEEQGAFQADADAQAPEILRARNAAVSLRHAAHGPHAQLHHRRRGGALQAHARLQRAASRSAGTPSDCPRKMPPSSAARLRANGPTPTSRR